MIILEFVYWYISIGGLVSGCVVLHYFDEIVMCGERHGMGPIESVVAIMVVGTVCWPELLWDISGGSQ